MKVELVRRFTFEAAHRNPRGNEKQQRLHGHSYALDVVVAGEVGAQYGWLMDYGEIKGLTKPCCDALDHAYLNEVDGLDDTALPGLRAWVRRRLTPVLPSLQDVRVSIVGDCAFQPVQLPPDAEGGLPARWRFTFEAAQSLPQLPDRHPCRRLHGHSYRVETGARELDRLLPALKSLYDIVDHGFLNEVEGLDGATCEYMCKWVWDRLTAAGHAVTAVVVQETDSARCIYYGQ